MLGMSRSNAAVHVVTTERTYKGKTYRSHLLRHSYREDGKVKNRTVANLTSLGDEIVDLVRGALRGKRFTEVTEAFEVVDSPQHGHVKAVMSAMRRLGFQDLLASRPSRQRDLVVAMVAARILEPNSKLATTRAWHLTTLPEILAVADADEDDLYEAMDWLLERQDRIEKKLAKRHLEPDALVLYDLSSSYFEGATCPLAARGHNRDGKKGKLQVNYGLLTDSDGIPVAVSVFEGNTGDPKTLPPQVDKLRDQFGIERFVLVGDRGMITQKQVEALRDLEGIDWISALRPGAIRKLAETQAVQLELFDERNLFEVIHADFPGERLVACRNPELAKRRAAKRTSLIEATVGELDKVRRMTQQGRLCGKEAIEKRARKVLAAYRIAKHYHLDVCEDGFHVQVDEKAIIAEAELDAPSPEQARKRSATARRRMEAIDKKLEALRHSIERGRLHGKDQIGLRAGKVVNKYKVAKHFKLDIGDNGMDFEIKAESVAAEAALDGIYVVRTSLPAERLSADDTVRSYKLLAQVERAFRSLKAIDLAVRPIRHRLEDRVRAHILLCMLAYYVQWHMVEAWRPLLFCDEDLEAKTSRDPVAPAKRSDAAMRKVNAKTLDDDTQVHSFRTLLRHLSGIVRNVCRTPSDGPDAPTFQVETTPDAKQRRAYELLDTIRA